MRLAGVLPLSLLALPSALGQLTLPSPPYTPPEASSGTQASNGTGANSQWSRLLGDLLYFYDEQRSGKLPSNERVPWRNDSALEDGSDVNLDLTGGYYDAGDYVKYTFPLSFTLMSVCWGVLDAGQGYESASQAAYLDDMLRWGLDWLIKAHPSPNTLFVQVGDGNLDNAYWGGDKTIPTPRPSYQVNDTSPGTDVAAQTSAAFAACSALYGNRTLSSSTATTALSNSSYASTLASHARELYAFAISASGGMQTYQNAVPQSGEAYASSGYSDELAIAALFLALAESSSNATAYYADAVKWYYSGNLGQQLHAGDETVFNWDAKTPGIVVLAAQLASVYPDVVSGSNATLQVWQGVAEGYFDAIANGTGRSHLTSGGLLLFPGDSDEASLNPALNVAMLMTRYAQANLTSEATRDRYLAFADAQLDYVLGKNPMSVPYIVGTHPNAPSNPHSAISTGFAPPNGALTSPENLDGDPPQEAHVLYGGVVGGPDARDRFWDLRSDWVQNEVALDYTAPLLTLAAQALVRGVGDPYYTQVRAGAYDEVRPGGWPCDAAIRTGCKRSGLSRGGKIAVGVVVSVVGLIVIGLGGYWVRRVRNNRKY
ncbi:Six-hairpin glycosidase [Trametes maxima]|nr:Six-hairpin glycosidase [Trametes maxima]